MSSPSKAANTGDTLEGLATEAAELVESYLKDCAATATSSLQLAQAGNYKVDNAMADGIKLWSMYLSGVAKAFDLGARTAKVYATKPADET